MHLVLNRAPTDRYRRAELTAEIYRTFTPASLTFVPSDRRVERAAWDGRARPARPVHRRRGRARADRRSAPRVPPPRGAAVAPREASGMSGVVVRASVVPSDAYEGIRRDVLARIERRQLRPEGDLDEVRVEVHRAVDEYERLARLGEELPLVSPVGHGRPGAAVDHRLRPDDRPHRPSRRRGDLPRGRARVVPRRFGAPARAHRADERGREPPDDRAPARATDRQLNTKHPMVQARVLDGTARLTAAIPPVGDRLSATLRRYVVRNVTLDDLVARDSLSREAAAFLGALMQLRSRVAVSGEPGAGKTTLAAALLAAGAAEPLRPLLRGDPRARGADHPRLVLRGAPAGARRHRRDQPARLGQVRARDAARPDRRRRGARRRGVRAQPGGQRRLRLPVHGPREQRRGGARRARQRGADGGRERHRAHRPQGVLGVARRRDPPRPRRHGQRRRRRRSAAR